MSAPMDETTPGRAPRRRTGAAIAVGLVAVALAVGLWLRAPETQVVEPDAEDTATSALDAEAEAPEAESADSAAEAAAGAETDEGTQAVADVGPVPEAPRFDLVRVAPDGAAVIAGQAAPGARVTVFSDETELATVEADAEGNFVAMVEAAPRAEPQALRLAASGADGDEMIRSDEVVMLLPAAPETGEPQSASAGEVASEPASDVEDTAEDAGAGDTAGIAGAGSAEGGAELAETAALGPATGGEEAADSEASEPEIAATAIVRDGAVEVVPTRGNADGRVGLSSISYGSEGAVTLAGTGAAGALLRAYVDDAFVNEARVEEGGRWTLGLAGLASGLYRLRLDQIDGEGRVTSRVETPFQRDLPSPRPRPGVAATDLGPGQSVTVQPGNNLWTLAQVHYGAGELFTQIFTANSELIADPDLIYPGQILELPGEEEP